MSLIHEKLRIISDSRKKDTVLPQVEKTFQESGHIQSTIKLSEEKKTFSKVWIAVGGGLAIVIFLLSILVVNGMTNRKVLTKDMVKIIKIQNEHIRELTQKISELESRQKKYSQNVDTKVASINDQMMRSERHLNEVSTTMNNTRDDIKNLRFYTQNMHDHYSDLASEIQTLKLLTVKESAAVIIPERKSYGKNN